MSERAAASLQPVTVHAVTDRSELRRFVDVAWQVHREELRWVPPLRSEHTARLRFRRNPFWRRADGRLFLARRGRAMMGRISVQIDAAHEADRRVALFGWFEASDDAEAAAALLTAAARWAADEGASELIGPASFTALDESGVLVEGFGEPYAFPWSWHPPHYAEALAANDLEPVSDLLALSWPCAPVSGPGSDGGTGAAGEVAKTRLRRAEAALLARAGDLDVACGDQPTWWKPTVAEVRARFRRWRAFLDPRVAIVDDAGAVAVAVPDLHEILRRLQGPLGPAGMARLLSKARSQPRAVSVGFLAATPGEVTPVLEALTRRAAAAGYERLEMVTGAGSPVVEVAEALGARAVRRYRTWRRDLIAVGEPPADRSSADREAAA